MYYNLLHLFWSSSFLCCLPCITFRSALYLEMHLLRCTVGKTWSPEYCQCWRNSTLFVYSSSGTLLCMCCMSSAVVISTEYFGYHRFMKLRMRKWEKYSDCDHLSVNVLCSSSVCGCHRNGSSLWLWSNCVNYSGVLSANHLLLTQFIM